MSSKCVRYAATRTVMADSEARQHIDRLMRENPVMVFSKPSCPYCKMAKEILDSTGVLYVVEEIDQRTDCQILQNIFKEMTGESTVPRVFVGGKCIGGGSDTKALHQQGKLVPLMKEAGASFKH